MAGLLLTLAGLAQEARVSGAGAVVSATIAKIQVGTVVTVASGSVTLTLPAASTAGNLLVAIVVGQKNASFSGPANWVQGPNVGRTNNEAEVWYYPNNPGGITSAAFTNTGTNFSAGQLSEWSGVATSSPLDKSGTASSGTATSIAVSTGGATTLAGELVVSSFSQTLPSPSTATFTPGANWLNLGKTGATSSWQYTADYRLGVAAGTISETETSSVSGSWAAAIAAFKPVSCTGGSLSLGTPASLGFPAVTLNGQDQSKTANSVLSPSDMTNSASGWNIQGTSTTFTAGAKTLPTTATRLTSASAVAASGNCTLPTSSITYPVTLPAAATAPSAVKLYNAAANSGSGPATVTLVFTLTVPANALSGSYSSTWTFSIASGP